MEFSLLEREIHNNTAFNRILLFLPTSKFILATYDVSNRFQTFPVFRVSNLRLRSNLRFCLEQLENESITAHITEGKWTDNEEQQVL